jgi:CheY-like chemotaxis protein
MYIIIDGSKRALSKFKSGLYDMPLLDVKMPNMDDFIQGDSRN